MSTSSAHKHVAEDTAVSTKSGGTSKSTTGSMRLSRAGGPAARAGFAAAADTAEVDDPCFFFFWGYRGLVHPPSDDEGTKRTWFAPEKRPTKRVTKRSVHGKHNFHGPAVA